jgi:hypothetical protein
VDEHLHDVYQDLQDLHARLVECFELVEDLRHVPGMSPELDDALAGLHYSIAKASQDASRLVDDDSLRTAT